MLEEVKEGPVSLLCGGLGEMGSGAKSCRDLLAMVMSSFLYFRGSGEPLKNFKQGRHTQVYIFRRSLPLLYATWIEGTTLVVERPIGELFYFSNRDKDSGGLD